MTNSGGLRSRSLARAVFCAVVSLVLTCGMTLPVGLAFADPQEPPEATLTVASDDDPSGEADVESIVANMTLDEKISQMIIPCMRTWEGTNVVDLDNAPDLARALRERCRNTNMAASSSFR